MRYLLGVDGGNTKTDYLLCLEDGTFVDVYRAGSASHEHFEDGYDGMERVMREQLGVILNRNNIKPGDIAAGGFGLAGADMPSQIEELTRRVKKIGFTKFTVANDGILGVKATSECGAGLCVVNGTGTVVLGIDKDGKILQVSGVGEMSGDMAGGGYAMRQIMLGLYSYYFRCGINSGLFPQLLELLNTAPEDLIVTVSDYQLLYRNTKSILQMADKEAQKGDPFAKRVFDDMGVVMGHSAAGCIRLLRYDDNVDIVLVGSIWHKIAYGGMKEIFRKTVEDLTGKTITLLPLNAPAAVGGVLWANEMLLGKTDPKARERILGVMTLDKYEELVLRG
jgi:N-acetylglucosamine kinase-like BadF-type ATPase